MKTTFASYCWLLVILAATTALALTHPKQKPIRRRAIVRQQAATGLVKQPYVELKYYYPPPQLVDDIEVPECSKAYTYVEQMPTLNGQNALVASSASIIQRLRLPSTAPTGQIFVKFEVTTEGRVAHPQILKGLRADLDSAVVAAVQQLPHFTPGKQNGRVVIVSLTLPITIRARKQP